MPSLLEKTAKAAARFIKGELGKVGSKDIEQKELNSLVSYVDKTAEQIIVKALRKLDLGAGFLTEEDVTEDSVEVHEYRWVIDPLDGTTNFLKGIPHFSVSIALEKNNIPILGVVEDIMQDQTYWAILNHGAFCDENKISTSKVTELSQSIVVTGFPYSKNYDRMATFHIVKFMLENCRGIRRLGSAALDLAYVASGKLEAYYESSLNRWDLSAGSLIVKEAGGVVSDFKAEQEHLESGNIIASNPHIYNEILPPIKTGLAQIYPAFIDDKE